MQLSGIILWSIWSAAAWTAFVFRPKQLVLTERSVPIGKRLTVVLLGLLYCLTVPTILIVLVVFVLGMARGLASALG
jgi:hypothetical protein